MREPTGAPEWCPKMIELRSPSGVGLSLVYAQNQYLNIGFQKIIINRRFLWFFGLGYEKRLLRAIRACRNWCEEENKRWRLSV